MPRQRKSLMWNHFEEIPGHRARCDHCLEYLSIAGGSMGNLKRHLRVKHPLIRLDEANETFISGQESGTALENLVRETLSDIESPSDSELELIRSRKRSKVWSHFSAQLNNRAKCQLCSKYVSIASGSTGNLVRHLRLRHSAVIVKTMIRNEDKDKEPEEDEEPSQENEEDPPQENCETTEAREEEEEEIPKQEPCKNSEVTEVKKHNRRSKIWSHFTVIEKGRARCDYCSSEVGFGHGSTGNLMRHLRAKHRLLIEQRNDLQLISDHETEPIVIDLGNFEAFSVDPSDNLLQTDLVEIPQYEKRGLYDLCIIGSGFFGSAAARHASANPLVKVVLIGPDDVDGRKSAKEFFSYHEGECVASIIDEQQPLQKLVECSINQFKELEKISGKKFYYPKGFMAFGRNGHPGMEEVKRAVALGKVPVYHMQTITDLSSRFPSINFNVEDTGFLETNASGCINLSGLLDAQWAVATQQGCDIIRDLVKDVLPVKKLGSYSCHKITLEKGPSVYAKRILICTGAFTKFKCLVPDKKEVHPMLGVVRETAALFEISSAEASKLQGMPILKSCSSPFSTGTYFLPPVPVAGENEEDLYCIKAYDSNSDFQSSNSSNASDVCDWYVSEGREETLESLLVILNDMLPDLKIHSVKSCPVVTCHTASSVPYISRISPTVTLAVGGGSRSAACSDEVGRIATQLCLSGQWDSEVPQLLFDTVWEKA